jgi:hypothetical protein
LVDAFCRLWVEVRKGDPYPVKDKDGKQVKQLLAAAPKAHELAEVETRIRRYLADSWCSVHGNLAHFCSQWPGLDGAVVPRNGVARVSTPAAPSEDFQNGRRDLEAIT